MMMHDDKKALMTIMSKRKKGGAEATAAPMKTEKVSDEDGEPDGRHAAAQDMIAAFHEKSPEKLMSAMAAFHDLHAMKSSAPAESEEA